MNSVCRLLLFLLVWWCCAGCAVRSTLEIGNNDPPKPATAAPQACADHDPPKLLQDPDCPHGICGYTCAPGRWKVPPP